MLRRSEMVVDSGHLTDSTCLCIKNDSNTVPRPRCFDANAVVSVTLGLLSVSAVVMEITCLSVYE